MRTASPPEYWEDHANIHLVNPRLFLAGGITHCPNWQQELIQKLEVVEEGVIFNPRRENFPIGDPNAALRQIEWEYHYLNLATMISFWFSVGSLNPIVLFELGTHSMRNIPIFVGVHPDYERRQDVEIQMSLRRPELRIVYSLEALAKQIIEFCQKGAP